VSAAQPSGEALASAVDIARRPTEDDRAAPHPLYCVWEITLACDLGCKHCGSRAGPARPDELTTAECLDVVAQLADAGLREVTLIGGEAYLRDDWDTIAAEITRRGMKCGITTGAMNLDADRISRAVDAGIRSISVSLDGLRDSHDAQRGVSGSWRAAVQACERIAATPIRLCNNTQINRLSMPELPAIARKMAELGSEAWQIQLTVPMGHGADRPDLLLQPYELLQLFPLLVWTKDELLTPAGITLFPGNNIGYYGPYEARLRYGGQEGAHWNGCTAGEWTLGLEADGAIKACPSLRKDIYGSGTFRDRTLAAALTEDPLTHLRRRTAADLRGYCATCYYARTCKAGCTWTSHVLMGREGDNPYCIHRALDREKNGLRESIALAAIAPGEPFDNGRFDLSVGPAPDGPPTDDEVLGYPLADVTALTPNVPTIHEQAHIDRVLGGRSRQAGRRALEQLSLGVHRD